MLDIYDGLAREGEALLRRLLDEITPEAVDLEFKTKSEAHRPTLNNDDKRNLGKTLSAFANSAGGLLIFGCRAKQIDGVDRLSELVPIADIHRFATEVQTLSGHYLMPRHEGIRQQVIQTDSDPTAGYLAVYVERSDRRPHQSKAPDDGRYYKRAGDSTFPMEHYDVEDAFKRATSADLDFEVIIGQRSLHIDSNSRLVVAYLALKNVGETLARYPYIHVLKANARLYAGQYLGPAARWKETSDEPGQQLTGGVDDVIHVGTTQIAGSLTYEFVRDVHGQAFFGGQPLSEAKIYLEVRFGAEAARAKEMVVEFSADQVAQYLRTLGLTS